MPPEIFSTTKQESSKFDHALNISLHNFLQEITRKLKKKTKEKKPCNFRNRNEQWRKKPREIAKKEKKKRFNIGRHVIDSSSQLQIQRN